MQTPSSRYTRRQVTRTSNGQYARYITGEHHSHPNLFNDEDELDSPRRIDVQFRSSDARAFVSVFNVLVERLGGQAYSRGIDTNKPAAFAVGEWYRTPRITIDKPVEFKIVTVYPMGIRWRLQIEFKGFVKPVYAVLMQHQLMEIKPERMYRGYDDEGTDHDWPVEKGGGLKNPLGSGSR